MAESITIKALQDASLDAKSLEEVVNGGDEKQVTTRLGENYPSVKKAIKNLFENGGLPATPFKTKALMTASALVDGKYAMVTEDTVNNGLYIKTAGAWVKSSYDPTAQSNLYTDKLSDKLLGKHNDLENVIKEIPLVSLGDGILNLQGVVTANGGFYNTDYISVEAGDYLVLENVRSSGSIRASFIFYNESKVLQGAMGYGSLGVLYQVNSKKLIGSPYSDGTSLSNQGAIITEKGYVKINVPKDTNATNDFNYLGLPTRLIKTNYEGYAKRIPIGLNKETIAEYKGLLKNALVGDATKDTSLAQVIGEVIKTNPSSKASYTSKKIAVSKGQYFHFQSYIAQDRSAFVVVDGSDTVIQNEYTVNEFSATPTESLKFFNNVPILQDGFVVLNQLGVNTSSGILYAVTDSKVKLHNETLDNNTKLSFYPQVSQFSSGAFSDVFERLSSNAYRTVVGRDNSHLISKPYVLKKGEVLEYSLEATSTPLLAYVLPYNYKTTNFVGTTVLPLLANEVINEKQLTDWYAEGKLATSVKQFYANASKGTVVFCNEESDSIVVFTRPDESSASFITYKRSTDYSLRILSKEQYKAKRNAELSTRFNTLSALPSSRASSQHLYNGNMDTGLVTYPTVLLFKGEVLNYQGGASNLASATNMNVLLGKRTRDELIDSISRLRYAPVNELTIAIDNPVSNYKDQIYAHETSVVLVGVLKYTPKSATNLDPDGIISSNYFEPRIVDIEDIVIGENVEAAYISALTLEPVYSTTSNTTRLINLTEGKRDSVVSYAGKGSSIEGTTWSVRNTIGLTITPLKPLVDTYHTDSYIPHVGEIDADFGKPSWASPQKVGYKLPSNSLVSVTSDVKDRDLTVLFANGSVNRDDIYFESLDMSRQLMPYLYELSLTSIPENEYVERYKVTDETIIRIADTKGLNFNFCNIVSASAIPAKTLLQIRSNKKVLAVVNTLTENQGQSTAASPRRNVNVEFFNSNWDKVYIKFGDEKEEQEVVIKSYLYTDRAHYKEVTSSNFWHDIRTSEPYPVGGVFPVEVFSDLSIPSNQVAKGTIFGFPLEQHRGDKFYSLGTLRNKKKRDNYAMEKGNRNHILLQADSKSVGNVNWSTVQMANFEVRNPSIKGYTEGDANLPAGWDDVESNINRLINWMKNCYTGATDLSTTYQDYIDLKSFIDYGIAITVAWHWDSVKNNFLLGTHDANIWRVYWYDSDQTWGSIGDGGEKKYFTLDSGNFFMKLLDTFPELVKERYARLRNLGIIDTKNLQDKMLELTVTQDSNSKELDIAYWGEVSETSGAPYSMWWIGKRIEYLDAIYQYADNKPNIVSQSVFAGTTLEVGETKSFNVKRTNATVGDVLRVELGEVYPNLSIAATASSDGSVMVDYTNNSNDVMKITQTYLRIYKEV